MTDKQKELKELLRDMFQMNNSDLDFGIYRIMNMKNREIEDFFERKLFSIDLQEKEEEIIYSNMVEFFSRYYKDGDFVSQRRYSNKDTYAIPYNGEEVKLHWANADQYYIKTSESFKDYTFKTPYATISFKIKEAETTANNNKSDKRYFVFSGLEKEENCLVIFFEYKAVDRKGQKLQEKINAESIESISKSVDLSIYGLDKVESSGKGKKNTRTLLEKHLARYTAKNSFDYFIHKDLGKFLRQELDNFIKSELISLDDILGSSEEVKDKKFERVKVFKQFSEDVIAFLAQLEDFQKQLWEKKKFVIETNYCITLDKIDEKYYEEILSNQVQLDEWVKLFDVKVECLDDLKAEPYLVLDTKFFANDFKYRLLAKFDDLDEETDGVLISSENFGALNLLQNRYKEQIKTIYIDPPYNTGGDGFVYKDNYQHSSWMSFMYDRLRVSRELLTQKGVSFNSIGSEEVHRLRELYNQIFSDNNFIGEAGRISKKANNQGDFWAPNFDYVLTFAKEIEHCDSFFGGINYKAYKEIETSGDYKGEKYQLIRLYMTSLDPLRGCKNQRYYIECPDGSYVIPPGENFPDIVKDAVHIEPKTSNDKVWRWTYETYLKNKDKIVIKKVKSSNLVDENGKPAKWNVYTKTYLKDVISKSSASPNNFIENHINQDASRELKAMGISFSYAKPSGLIKYLFDINLVDDGSIILDYFAGTASAGHALIKMNRKDQKNRKYILVEMGEYFDTVTKPRIQKVIYTNNWRDGKPQDKVGISQMFKYLSLESYEDTLNNLRIDKKDEVSSLPFNDEYVLHYMLNDETRTSQLDIDRFDKPFDYKLNIATGIVGETREIAVDLVETFNYLLGLKVKTIRQIDGVLVVRGETRQNEKVMVVWREEECEISKALQKEFMDYERVYINGDTDIAMGNIYLTEKYFQELMFEGV